MRQASSRRRRLSRFSATGEIDSVREFTPDADSAEDLGVEIRADEPGDADSAITQADPASGSAAVDP
jgi:hypothetical protein